MAAPDPADVSTPTPVVAVARTNGQAGYAPSVPASNSALNPSAVSPVGGNNPHNNLMPYLVLNYCIALQGVYPPRV